MKSTFGALLRSIPTAAAAFAIAAVAVAADVPPISLRDHTDVFGDSSSLSSLIPFDSGVAAGTSVAVLGDIDSNGVDDFAVGVSGDTSGSNGNGAWDPGMVLVLLMETDGTASGFQKINSDDFPAGTLRQPLFGFQVHRADDVNGDGTPDLLVSTRGLRTGEAFVVALHANGTVKEHLTIDGLAVGETNTQLAGTGLGLIAPASNAANTGETILGFVRTTHEMHIVRVNSSMQITKSTRHIAGQNGLPDSTGSYIGNSVSGGYDVDGDSICDCVWSASADDSLVLLLLNSDDSVRTFTNLREPIRRYFDFGTSRIGFGVRMAASMDPSSSTPSVLVPYPNNGFIVVYLNASGLVTDADLVHKSTNGLTASSNKFGISVDVLPDKNGDSRNDFIVGDTGLTSQPLLLFHNLVFPSPSPTPSVTPTNSPTPSVTPTISVTPSPGFNETLTGVHGFWMHDHVDVAPELERLAARNSFLSGVIVPVGDVDGNGVIDLALSNNADGSPSVIQSNIVIALLHANRTVKAVHVIHGNSGDLPRTVMGFTRETSTLGTHMAAPGDVDGDGIPDLLIGANPWPTADANRHRVFGSVVLLTLNTDGSVKNFTETTAVHLDDRLDRNSIGRGTTVITKAPPTGGGTYRYATLSHRY